MLQIFEKEASTEFHLSMLGIVEDSCGFPYCARIVVPLKGFFSNSRLEVSYRLTRYSKHLHKFEASNS